MDTTRSSLLLLLRFRSTWNRLWQKIMQLDIRQSQSLSPSPSRIMPAWLLKLSLGAAAVTIVALLLISGHTILSIWAAFMFLAWLFIAGASIATGDHSTPLDQPPSEGDADQADRTRPR